MPNAAIQCPNCHAGLPDELANRTDFTPCPVCTTPLLLSVFPAFHRELAAGHSGEAIMVEGESSCFYHPQKKAVLPCDGCGRFLCALCDCPLDGRHFCPSCLETGQKKGKIKSLENQRMLYGDIALTLTVIPILIFYISLITAPAALYVAIRYWKAPQSLVRPNRTRYVLAIILALLQIAGWATVIILFTTNHRSRG